MLRTLATLTLNNVSRLNDEDEKDAKEKNGDSSCVRHEPKWFEIDVDLPELHNPHSVRRMPVSQKECPNNQREIEYRDEKMKTYIAQYYRHKRRRLLLLTFADDPINTLKLLIVQHPEYLQVGQGGKKSEDPRRSSYFQNEWLPDAVDNYLKKQGEKSNAIQLPDFLDQVRE